MEISRFDCSPGISYNVVLLIMKKLFVNAKEIEKIVALSFDEIRNQIYFDTGRKKNILDPTVVVYKSLWYEQ